MSELTERTNEADIAAVTEVVHTYYDGMVTADEVKLARAFHPNARLVGNNQGKLMWQTLEEFVEECKEAAGHSGADAWRIDLLSFEGDTALVRLSDQFAGDWYSDDYPCFGSTALGASSTRRGMSIPRGRPRRNRPGIRLGWFGTRPRRQLA